ncbi:MAG: TOBE domain-containing protein, partial [Deltaproteobacteria bacterium]|nr:TOBE domain-containing protein [Deltaproteobacteria bacterium]
QVGSPQELMLHGKNSQSGFLEKPNVLPCKYLKSLGNGLIQVQWASQQLLVPEDSGKPFTRVSIQPEQVYISPHLPPGPQVNRFEGRIMAIRHVRGMAHLEVRVGDERVRAQMTMQQARALSLSTGDSVYGIFKLRALHGC